MNEIIKLTKTIYQQFPNEFSEGLEYSIKFWVKHPEFLDKMLNEKRIGVLPISDKQIEAIQMIKDYTLPHETAVIQRMSEEWRNLKERE